MPLRSDSNSKQTPLATPSHTSSHRRHISKDSVVSLLHSPYINRRPLDAKTEQELRAACALVLQNFKPSDHEFADADPKLDFSGPHKRREQKPESSHVRVHKPTGAPAEQRGTHGAKKHSHKTDPTSKGYPDLPMQANTGRRRVEHTEKEIETRKHAKSPSNDQPRSATMRTDIDSDDAKSLATPLTASTDAHFHNGSTAPTSVAFGSGRSSKRTSHQFENVAAVADAEAAEWMRTELEKRRHQLASQPQTEQSTSHRPPSRASSIKAGIKEYIFPGSTNLSRKASHESIRTMNSANSSGQPKRSASSHGWRSWGLQRKSSSRSNSRPGTSNGRIERPEPEKKPELNLNRELPPLPSLDTWKEAEKPKEKRKSQAQGAHIATVMRSQDQQQQEYAAAVRRHHRRSGSDTLAMKYANAYSHVPGHSTYKTPGLSSFPEKRVAPEMDVSMDFDHMMSTMSSTRNFDDQLKLRVNGHAPQRSTSTASRDPSAKVSSDLRSHAPNFSRKISTDVPPPQRHYENNFTYPNMVQISGPPRKDEQKSRLKRAFSGWMLKKDKKDDWMQKFEKEGIKNGVMIQDEAALPPVVRY